MSDPYKFLTSLGQTLAVLSLYPPGHPARERALDASFELFAELDRKDARPEFSFLGGEVIYRRQIVPGLTGWEWGARLAGAGIERIEFLEGVSREEYGAWLEEIRQLIAGEALDTAEARQIAPRNIRYGLVEVRGGTDAPRFVQPRFAASTGLGEEVATIRWMHDEVERLGQLPLLEAMAVVRSLSVAMHGQSQIVLPLLQLKGYDQYTTTHSSNVAVLTMALTEFLGFPPRDIRVFGVAGLLHDLGKVRIPHDILVKPGRFTDAEREIIQRHPIEGAKLILERETRLDVAAFVAYEHHIMLNGGGYPSLRYARGCHYASQLVHVCDVYDALCTDRPYRSAWTSEKAVAYLKEKAGTEFDPEIVTAFTTMIGNYGQVRTPLEEAPGAGAGAGAGAAAAT
jgi:putative nucleotidyltransferase with HDIG domain